MMTLFTFMLLPSGRFKVIMLCVWGPKDCKRTSKQIVDLTQDSDCIGKNKDKRKQVFIEQLIDKWIVYLQDIPSFQIQYREVLPKTKQIWRCYVNKDTHKI